MTFYDVNEPQSLDTDTLGISIGAGLLQVRDRMNFPKDTAPGNTILIPIALASKSISSAETSYSNIEREKLGILYGLQNSITIALPDNYT